VIFTLLVEHPAATERTDAETRVTMIANAFGFVTVTRIGRRRPG
jgi:hypothetical protein